MNLAAMNSVSHDHAGSAAALLVTLSGLGATLGVAVTGAIFTSLQTNRTIDLVGEAGVTITGEQAEKLDGILAGTSGATSTLDKLAGADVQAVTDAVREAFISALGTSLKLSAALIAVGAVLAVVLFRRSTPEDAAASDHPVSAMTPRPAPRGVRRAAST
jgi:hypothetical protein